VRKAKYYNYYTGLILLGSVANI